MRYNLLDEKWLIANNKRLSLTEVFEKAENINCLGVPTINGSNFAMYEYVVYRFLINLTSAALHRTSTRITVTDSWSDEQIDSIRDYLKTNHDLFDLFDENHPFMQWSDEQIKQYETLSGEKVEVEYSKECLLSNLPYFLSQNELNNSRYLTCPIKTTKTNPKEQGKDIVNQYNITIPDFIYQLLYLNSLHGNPGVSGCSAIMLKGKLFGLVLGKNLVETLLINSVQYDNRDWRKPMWEMNPNDYFFDNSGAIGDLFKMFEENNVSYKNGTVFGSFAPTRIIRARTDDGINIASMINVPFKGTVKELSRQRTEQFPLNCDRNVITNYTTKKDGDEEHLEKYCVPYNRETNMKTLVGAVLGSRVTNSLNTEAFTTIFSKNRRIKFDIDHMTLKLFARDWDTAKGCVYKAVEVDSVPLNIVYAENEIDDMIKSFIEDVDILSGKTKYIISKVAKKQNNSISPEGFIRNMNIFIYDKLNNWIESGRLMKKFQESSNLTKTYKNQIFAFYCKIKDEFFDKTPFDLKESVITFYKIMGKEG